MLYLDEGLKSLQDDQAVRWKFQGKKVVSAKWVFRNKLDETVKVVRNMTKLVVKGYS